MFWDFCFFFSCECFFFFVLYWFCFVVVLLDCLVCRLFFVIIFFIFSVLLLFWELFWFVFLFLFLILILDLNCLLSFDFCILNDNILGNFDLELLRFLVFFVILCFFNWFCKFVFWEMLFVGRCIVWFFFFMFLFVEVFCKVVLEDLLFCGRGLNGVFGLLIGLIISWGGGVKIGLLLLKWG